MWGNAKKGSFGGDNGKVKAMICLFLDCGDFCRIFIQKDVVNNDDDSV